MTWSTRPAADGGPGAGSAGVPAGGCAATEVEVAVAEFVAASPWGRFASVFGEGLEDAQVSEEVLLRRLGDAEGLKRDRTTPTGRTLTTQPHDYRPDTDLTTDTQADPPPF